MHPIGYVRTSYREPSDAPSQASESGGAVAEVVLDDQFVDGLLGLEQYEYLWLFTWLHVRGGQAAALRVVPRVTQETGELQGVFACRFPQRPNPIGLSLVRQIGIEGNVITLAGVDVVDGTPVLDIKPWFDDCDLPSNFESSPG